MPETSTKLWIKASLFNLLIVASIGVLMRFKIGFEFPLFDQKHLQYAHSHFAFNGWITQTLFVLIIQFLTPYLGSKRLQSYRNLVITNLICAYAMLVLFAIEGYGLGSIFFSTLSVFVSFVFAFFCYSDLNKAEGNHPSILWFRASLIFAVLSSIGTFSLAYMMGTKHIPQHAYLVSVYWFLHFQYNGWFFFACIGLLLALVTNIIPNFKISNSVFWLFALSCIPAYGLSTLWLDLPIWLYLIIVAGAVGQFVGWIKLFNTLRNCSFLKNDQIHLLHKFLLVAVAIALTVKLSLQLASIVPAISKLAFGFRPIVIAYLHLILLAILSVFLITYFSAIGLISMNLRSKIGLVIFGAGVFINEILLATQGIASLTYHVVPYINELLFVTSIILFSGIATLILGQFIKPVCK